MDKPTEAEMDEARRKYGEAMEVFRRNEPDPPRKRHGRDLGSDLCRAFGLPGDTVRRLELIVGVDAPVVVNVEHYVKATDSGLAQLVDKFSTYELVPREATEETADEQAHP